MKVVITGGAGFLGQRLARKLLLRGALRGADGNRHPIERITLVDVTASPVPHDPLIRTVAADIADDSALRGIIDSETTSIFHLAAIVSGMAEAHFDLGMRVNLDATRRLLDVCRDGGRCPTLVFTSSVAVYGGDLPPTVPETAALNPQTSYGTQKAIAELLIGDYTRKGFIDGRALRLPTITVRPGRPNAAASSFASGIIREPLNGQEAVCPVDPGTRLWLLSPTTVVDCLITGHELPGDAFGSNRSLNLPGMSVTVGEMVAALERVAGPEVTKRIRWERDPRLERMVYGWPGACDATRAVSLGFQSDETVDAIIQSYIDEELGGARSVPADA